MWLLPIVHCQCDAQDSSKILTTGDNEGWIHTERVGSCDDVDDDVALSLCDDSCQSTCQSVNSGSLRKVSVAECKIASEIQSVSLNIYSQYMVAYIVKNLIKYLKAHRMLNSTIFMSMGAIIRIIRSDV